MASKNTDPNQPMLDSFEPVPGIDFELSQEERLETASKIADVGRGRLPIETRTSEAYADLGGGTSETAAQDPPEVSRQLHKSSPTGHVRDIEPRDSDLDEYWTAPTPEFSDEDRARLNAGIKAARASVARGTAQAKYDYLQQFPVNQQLTILRAREERRGSSE